MSRPAEFTPFDFFRLAKDLSEHEVEMKIRLARAGVGSDQELRTPKDK